jgi:hypothetical protein
MDRFPEQSGIRRTVGGMASAAGTFFDRIVPVSLSEFIRIQGMACSAEFGLRLHKIVLVGRTMGVMTHVATLFEGFMLFRPDKRVFLMAGETLFAPCIFLKIRMFRSMGAVTGKALALFERRVHMGCAIECYGHGLMAQETEFLLVSLLKSEDRNLPVTEMTRFAVTLFHRVMHIFLLKFAHGIFMTVQAWFRLEALFADRIFGSTSENENNQEWQYTKDYSPEWFLLLHGIQPFHVFTFFSNALISSV